jgi:hypothetical protein
MKREATVKCGRPGGAARLARAAALGLALCAGVAWAASPEFRTDAEALTRGPHRLAGTEEGRAAAEHVQRRLTELGADPVLVQEFPVLQTRDLRCELVLAGAEERALKLVPMRPNGIIPPVTPPEGVSGPLVRLGSGRAEDYTVDSVAGAIVVMDYNSEDRWLRALRLGAKAVIFTGGADGAESLNPHSADVEANLLRFYYPGNAADLAAGVQATIHSEAVWERMTGRNVYGFFRGTAPVFGGEGSEELIVLAADLDSYGDVPRLSPGARGAANGAALLQLAGDVGRHRPRRNVLVAFFDGEARGQAGVSRFYRALEREEQSATVDARLQALDQRRSFVRDVGGLMQREDPLGSAGEVPYEARQAFLQYLRDKAAEHTFAVNDAMIKLRKQRDALRQERKKEREAGVDRPGAQERIDAISQALAGARQSDKDRWNDLRRALEQAARLGSRKQGAADLPPEVRERLELVLAEVRRDFRLRTEELAAEEREVAADRALRDVIGGSSIVLHASLLLGDTTPRWGLIMGGDSIFNSAEDTPAMYGKIQTAFLRAWRDSAAQGQAPEHFAVGSADQTLAPTRMLWAAPHLIHSGSMAGLCGVFNLALGTCQERLTREGTPADTLEHLDLDRVAGQADEISRLLLGVTERGAATVLDSAVASQAGLSLRQGIRPDRLYKLGDQRPTVMGVLPGGSIPNRPVRGAVVQIRRGTTTTSLGLRRLPYAYENFLLAMTDSDGRYEIGPAYGDAGFAAVFDERGLAVEVSDQLSQPGVLTRLNVFGCRPGFVVLPPQVRTSLLKGDAVSILSAGPNALLDPAKSFFELGDGLINWYGDRRTVNEIKLFGLRQIVALNNGGEALDEDPAGAVRGNPTGVGFPSDPVMPPLSIAQRSASDLWRLNESRLQILRGKDIRDSAIEELHGRSEDILLAAQTEGDPVRREAVATCSFLASQPVYRSVRATLDDLVFAVLILLLLSIPFAFVMERVIIGATTIYRQVLWFAVFFALTFLLLYATHPAFAIAGTPMIIFLGFAVLMMSVLVIGILMRKFDVELKAVQGIGGTVHTADVSRVTTLMAAMHMGVSTLRRRPLRTSLTAVTIILLTFTILSFASFGTRKGLVRLPRGANPGYAGVWLHDLGWGPLAPDMAEVIEGRWGRSGAVCRRVWVCTTASILSRQDGASEMVLRGVVGFEPKELERRPDLAALVGTNLADTVRLTRQTALRLGVSEGDTALVNGVRLRVGPLLDAVALSNLKDMDGGSVLPIDVTQGGGGKTEMTEDSKDLTSVLQVNWTPLPADAVAIVSAETARRLGGFLCGIAVYAADTDAAGEMADDLARTLVVPVNATLRSGVYFHGLGVLLAASGVRDLFFPILLGGLVIFGTMLGSVADREREIYTFSALGLAPRHVAMLFFAESLVYSLIGGMGGYLLAQGTVKVLTLLARHGLAVVPEMNVSSTNTIVTILIVMGTVLISSIYPALKASRSANPGLMRTWRPPPPKGNVLDLIFPFTVSQYDIAGVVSFLKEHFDVHSETGLGRFLARDVRLVRGADGQLGLEAHVALAPFDLGVGQAFELRSVPSEIPGIDEVKVRLERTSGQPKDWQRLYKVFLDDLRRQFLIWRSLPQETMEMYRHRTLTDGQGSQESEARNQESERGLLSEC